jgi:hypothetical protein
MNKATRRHSKHLAATATESKLASTALDGRGASLEDRILRPTRGATEVKAAAMEYTAKEEMCKLDSSRKQ